MKCCNKCGVRKCPAAFPLRKESSDGRKGECRACVRAYQQTWKKRNPARVRGLRRKYYSKNREQIRSRSRERYALDPRPLRSARAKWRQQNPEKVRIGLRKSALKSKYGLTWEKYQTLLRRQNRRCRICSGGLLEPHVDHDHSSGKVRGLLCHNCNTALGMFKDSARLLRRAAMYIEISFPCSI
jgi:hypothetical protein